MAQAEPTIITRRALVAGAAAGVSSVATATLPVQALASIADPILDLIAAHKAAYVTLDRACRLVSDLEQKIPEERRKEWFAEDRGTAVGANDDPRWTAAMAAYWAASNAEEQSAWALAHARPTRVASVAALLRYAYEYPAQGCEWPSLPEEEGGREDWNDTLHRSLAAALDALV
jgi:hypothetical protein